MSRLLVLPVVLPLIGAALSILVGRSRTAQRSISIVVLVTNLVLAVALLVEVDRDGTLVTQAGGWEAPIGITLVADRLAASPGSKIYGVPSVKAAWYGRMRKAGVIGMNVFWPAPKIHSGLVEFTRHEPPATHVTRDQVFAVIDAAFAQRRKTLRAALAGWAGGAVEAERCLVAAGVDPTARGEVLDIGAYVRIAEARHPAVV